MLKYLFGAFLVFGVILFVSLHSAFAATRTWDGGGTTNNWSDCANWSLDTCPTTADIVTFDATSTKDATIDSGFTTGVTTLNVNAGYTGTITQARSFTVSGNTAVSSGTFLGSSDALTFTGTFTLSGGTFTGGSGTITNTGTFTISSGAYTASSGTTKFAGAFTHTAGGTFAHNNGLVQVTGTARTWNVITSESLYDLEVTKTSSSALTVTSGDVLVVAHTLTLTDGAIDGGAVEMQGTLSHATTFDGGSGTIRITGTDVKTITLSTGLLPGLNISNADATVNGAATVSIGGNLTMSAGTFNPGSTSTTIAANISCSGGTYGTTAGTLDVNGNFTLSGGTFNAPTSNTFSLAGGFAHTAGGTFNNNSGTMIFDTTSGTGIDVASTETFYNLTKNSGVLKVIATGDTLIVTNMLTLNDGIMRTGTIQVQGDVSVAAAVDADATMSALTFAGTADQSFSIASAAVYDGDITINKPTSGTVTLQNDLTVNATNQDLRVTAGTLDVNGKALIVNGTGSTMVVSSGGTVQLQGGESITATPTLSSGSTVKYNGSVGPYTLQDWTYTNAAIVVAGGASSVFTLPGTKTANNLTITSGIFSLNGNGLTVSTTYSNDATLRLIGSEAVALTMDTDSGTTTYVGDGDTAADTYTLIDFGVTDYYNLAIATTDAADIVQSAGAKVFAGTLAISSGTYDANGQTTTTTGLATLSGGTYAGSTATQTFDAGLTLSGGTYTGSSGTADVNGGLTLTTGTFTAPTSTTISGNFTKGAATFTHNNGTVTLDPNVNHTITGDTSWYALTLVDSADNATDVVLTLAASSTQTINGTLTLDGFDASDRLNIVSSSSPTVATIDFEGASTFSGDFLDITDNTAVDNSSGVSSPVDVLNSIDGGGTTNWFQTTPPGITVGTISGNTTEAGGTATFTIVLDTQPTNDVTIGFSSSDTSEGTVQASKTFTSGNWNAPQAVTVTGVNDDLDDGDIAYSILTAAATSADGNYNGINPSDVSATNTDDDVSGFTVSSISGNTTEVGGTATATIVLTAQPTADVTVGVTSSNTSEGTVVPASVTFTSLNWSTPQSLTVTGVDDLIDDGDVVYAIVTAAATSGDANYQGLNPSDVSVANTDDDTAGATASAISGHTSEDEITTAIFTVVLTAQPTANVTIPIATADATEGVSDVASLVFTSGNWTTPQMVTVTGVNDYLDDGNVSYSIALGAITSADTAYSGLDPSDVAAVNDDDDVSGFTVGAISGNTTEAGGTATFTIVLNAQPTAGVTIDLSSSDTTEGTVAASVAFTTGNWNTPKVVTVTGVDDSIDDGTVAYTIITAAATSVDANYNGLNPADVSVATTDDDTAGITVGILSGNTTESGGTATFTVVLHTQPIADVTVGFSSSDSTEGTVQTSKTFTSANWSTPQAVTVTGVDDDLDDGDIAYTIITAAATSADAPYSGLNPDDVSATNTDNDVSGFTVGVLSGDTTEAGGIATFTVVLNAQPTASVSMSFTSSDLTEGTVSPATLTFTTGNWNTPQSVAITGVDDAVIDGSTGYSIVTGAAVSDDVLYSGINPSDISVTNTDNDVAGATVGAISGNTTEAGGTATFTMVLATQPSASVTFDLSSSDTTEGTVAPASLTFSTENWNAPQTVTVTGVDDGAVDGPVTYTILIGAATSVDLNYDAVNPADVDVTNTDNDAVGVSVSPSSGNTSEAGGTAAFSIVLRSQPSADVLLSLSSSQELEGILSAPALTFTSGNWNIPQIITVTGVDDVAVDGDVLYTMVLGEITSADVAYAGLNPDDISLTNTDNDVASVLLTQSAGSTSVTEVGATDTYTVVLSAQPSSDVTVSLTAEAPVATDLASLTFTSGNWNTPQTITVSVTDDLIAQGAHAHSVQHTTSSLDPLYSALVVASVSVQVTDNDVAGITVGTLSGNTTEAGGTATLTLVLASEPTADVRIDVSSSDTTEGTVDVATATFTSVTWNVPQTITVTGIDDAVNDGTVAYTIVLANPVSGDAVYAAINPADVSVSNTDNDTPGFTVVESSGATAVTEGSTQDAYTIVLTSQPTASVNVFMIGDGDVTTNVSELTFTTDNWNVPQAITVSAVDDSTVEGAEVHSILHVVSSVDSTYAALTIGGVPVTVTDNDPVSIESGGGGGGGGGGGSTSVSTSPTISLRKPVAGATYGLGPVSVTWAWTGSIPAVSVYLSLDGGTTWSLRRYFVTNNGSTTITLDQPSTNAMVRIEGTDFIQVLARSMSDSFIVSATASSTSNLVPGTSEDAAAATDEAIAQVAARVASLPAAASVHHLVKLSDDSDTNSQYDTTVYYVGADGYRHAFPNMLVYGSWFCTQEDVAVLTSSEMASIPIGQNVTYRPGSRLVKFITDPRVYAIDSDGSLRWVMSEGDATVLYGADWNTKVDDIQDVFYRNYHFGAVLTDLSWDHGAVHGLVSYPSDVMHVPGYAVIPGLTGSCDVPVATDSGNL